MKLYTSCFFTHSFSDPVNRSHAPLYMLKKARGRDGYYIKWNFAYAFDAPENKREFVEAGTERDAVRKFTERRLDWCVVDMVTIHQVTI